MAKLLRLKPSDYTVAWLCALPKSELVAATMMLDERHEELRLNQQDRNLYTYGSINGHNVVLSCLPPGQPGKLSGLRLVQPLSQSFPNLRIHLFVGIGGGVPRDPPPEDPQQDVHLGDVVVGWAEKTGDPGVVQWDYVRYHDQDKVESLGSLNKPDWQLVAALGSMLRDREIGEKPFYAHLTALNEKTSKFANPGQDDDNLFQRAYEHVNHDKNATPCSQCDPSQLANRSRRTTQEPVFHQGTIASGDSVMQNAERRDAVSRKFYNAICFEMEAAGVIDETRCLVIRGISDYCDSHKNGLWQNYAAATAAAFAKQFLFTIQPSTIVDIDPVAVSQMIQALSSPLQTINKAFPPIQQQTENTAITVRALHDEVHTLRREAQNSQERVLQGIIGLANRADHSSRGLDSAIIMTLDSYSAKMNNLRHDLIFSQSQHTDEVIAKLEAVDQSIKGLQLGLISKPGLMHSVCKENDRLKELSASVIARSEVRPPPKGVRAKSHQTCSCKPNPNKGGPTALFKSNNSELAFVSKWNLTFEIESISHDHSCPLFPKSAKTTEARFRLTSCGRFLARAIEASISIKRGAGGSSISPVLQCAYVVHNKAAFQVIALNFDEPRYDSMLHGRHGGLRVLEAWSDSSIHELQRLFDTGKASPYDVDLEGNTLLHLAAEKWIEFVAECDPSDTALELMVVHFKKLEELHVPVNWTNAENLTFMNTFALRFYFHRLWGNFATLINPLLDTGAEFAKFGASKLSRDLISVSMCGLIGLANSVDFINALEAGEVSVAVLHRSERELVEALKTWPQLIDMGNGLAQTPLHLAVGWPKGVRLLLKHGACVDSRDHAGDTPLYYALTLGCPQTVSLLMEADCSLVLRKNVLDLAISLINSCNATGLFETSRDVFIKTLDTTIASLAERRRDLQNRLTGLPVTVSIDTTVLRDDRILDEYAEYAEYTELAAQENNDHIPPRVSSLLNGLYFGRCRTVYHISYLVVEVAEKLWETGFRDIDVPDDDGLTPLASWRSGMSEDIELCSWLIQKGANLQRPQHRLDDNGPDPAIVPTELLHTTRMLHYVAFSIGFKFQFETPWTIGEIRAQKEQLQNWLSRLSKNARLLLATIFSDCSSDDCICACSPRGCRASTLMLKGLKYYNPSFLERDERDGFTLYSEYLMKFVGLESSCWDWLAKEIIRFCTFQELELRHTCCSFSDGLSRQIVKFEEEERAEIQDEDKDKIELLENLLLEFEEHRGTEDLLSFLEGYWAVRMDEVLEELKSGVDEEGLRGIGVVLEESVDDDWGQRMRYR